MASIHNKWYYVKEPVYPPTDSSGNHFKLRAIYPELIEIIKKNPGLTGREIAEKMGRKERNVSTFLWSLRRYTGSIDFVQEGYHRTPGLNEFQDVPCVQKMISKAASQKTWDPWIRRLFNYEKWLKANKHFESITKLLDDFKGAKSEDTRYAHIDLLSDYINSIKANKNTKDTVVKAVRAFYTKNRSELPHEKITYRRDMLSSLTQTASEYVKPEEIWKIVSDGAVSIRDKALIACMLCLGIDESTFCNHFNYYAYPQIVAQLGANPKEWDFEKAPIKIELVRSKTQNKYYNFLPGKALDLLRDWLNVRKDFMSKDIAIFKEDGMPKSDPIFVTHVRNPIDEHNINEIVRENSFRSGVQQRIPGTRIYRIHAHEFRDSFRTTCKVAGVDSAVSEFFIGHRMDEMGYDKSPNVYPEFFKEQYQLVEPLICGEPLRVQFSRQSREDLEKRLQTLESQLQILVAEKAQSILSQGRGRNEGREP